MSAGEEEYNKTNRRRHVDMYSANWRWQHCLSTLFDAVGPRKQPVKRIKVKTETENKIKGKTVCKSKFPRDGFDDVMLRISIDPANIVEEDSRLTQQQQKKRIPHIFFLSRLYIPN